MLIDKLNSFFQKFLAKFYETLDIVAELRKVSISVERANLEWGQHFIVAVVYSFLTLVSGYFSWRFDLRSTWDALELTRVFVVGDNIPQFEFFPTAIQEFTLPALFVFALGLTPTLLQLFGPTLAKAEIFSVKIIITVMSIFDVVTDIPTVTVFMMQQAPYFDSIGIMGVILYPIAFTGMLAAATFYFELLTLIFFWKALAHIFRGLDLMGAANKG